VKEEAVISAQCHSTLKELIILWTVNGHPLDGRIKRWSLPSVRPSLSILYSPRPIHGKSADVQIPIISIRCQSAILLQRMTADHPDHLGRKCYCISQQIYK